MILINNSLTRTAIVSKDGKVYYYSDLRKEVDFVKYTLNKVEPNVVAIYGHDETLVIASIIAAIETNTSFCILNLNDPLFKMKLGILDPNMLISDYTTDLDNHHVKLNLISKKLVIGSKSLIDVDASLKRIINSVGTVNFKPTGSTRCINNVSAGDWISFENYLNEGNLVRNKISIENVLRGLLKWKAIEFKSTDVVYYDESMDLIYNVVNGILSPLYQGIVVTFSKSIKLKTKNWCLYTSSRKLTLRLKDIWNEQSSSNRLFNLLKTRLLLKNLKSQLDIKFKRIIISKTDTEDYLINKLKISKTVLWVNPQVASFVTINGFSTINDHFEVQSKRVGLYGEIFVKSVDSKHPTIFNNTGDIGKIKEDGSIHIMGKASNIISFHFERMVEIGKITNFIFSQPYVENCQMVCDQNGNLIMLIEPHIDNCNLEGWSNDELQDRIYDLQDKLSKTIKDGYFIKLELYSGKLDLQAYHDILKIVND